MLPTSSPSRGQCSADPIYILVSSPSDPVTHASDCLGLPQTAPPFPILNLKTWPARLSQSFGLAGFFCLLGLMWAHAIPQQPIGWSLEIASIMGLVITLGRSCWVIRQLFNEQRKIQRYFDEVNRINQWVMQQVNACVKTDRAVEDYTLTIQDLYNRAPCGYHSIDASGKVVLMNDTELEMLGYSREEVVGKQYFWDFVSPESQQIWQDRFAELKSQGWVKDVEIHLKHRSGRIFPVLINSTVVWDKEGQYQMSRSTVIDVSRRKEAEMALRNREAQYRGIVEDQTELICRFLPDGTLTFVNQAYCRYFELSARELIGQSCTTWIPEDDRIWVQMRLNQLTPDAPTIQHEHRIISAQGEVRWQAWTNRAFFDDTGTIIEYQAVGRDISDEKFQDAALEKLSNALEMAVVGIAEVNPQGRYVHVNDAYAEMMGYTLDELHQQEWWSLIDRRDRTRALQAYQQMMQGERAEVEVTALHKSAPPFDQKIVLVKAYDQNQDFVGHYCFVQDISARRELDRMKDEFVSVVSHELRTPLTSIAGALDLLASGVLQANPTQSQRMIEIAAQNTDRLVRMINDILDVERIKSGKIVMNRDLCDLAHLLQQSIEVMQPLADRHQITLALDSVEAVVSIDRDRVTQVMTNLISNAIKFSDPGGRVDIIARHVGPRSMDYPVPFQIEEPQILVAVKDHGRGIPNDKLMTIFEPFQQVDASDSRQKGGTGLGLAICRSILNQHNAQFWVESQLHEGSTFYFMLPIFPNSSTTLIYP